MEEIQKYINAIPSDKKEHFLKLRETISSNIPNGFEEQFSYGMIGFVVPFSIYPNGYHCNTKLPLPFLNIANQKKATDRILPVISEVWCPIFTEI